MSLFTRLFGQPKSSQPESKPRLGFDSLEAREVPAITFVGGWGASSYQYATESPSGAASSPIRSAAVPQHRTDQSAINSIKIEVEPAPASDYLLILEGVKGESGDRHNRG